MKKHFLVALIVLTILSIISNDLSAQIALSLGLNRKNYLQYEHVFAKVKLRNYAGSALVFSDKNPAISGGIKFEIFGPDGNLIPPSSSEIPEIKGILLKPGETSEVIIPVSKYYKLTDIGKYRMKAIVFHSTMSSQYQSDEMIFSIQNGITVWKMNVGLPSFTQKDVTEANGKIKTRQYRISTIFDGQDKILYLIIEDPQRIYSIKRIGYEMADKAPNCEIDNLSRLHILQKLTSTVFIYMLVNIDGTRERKEIYKKKDTTPILVRDPETGDVVVAGGVPAEVDKDYNETEDDIFK